MTNEPPPPVLGSARVIAYALVDDSVVFTGRNAHYSGGELLGRVPRLAICMNMVESDFDKPLLFYCDEQWNVLGCRDGESVQELKDHAERNYKGISPAWMHLDTTLTAGLEYFDREVGARCSFCDRREFDVRAWTTRGRPRSVSIASRGFNVISLPLGTS